MMNRHEYLKSLSIEDVAKMIVEEDLTDSFCKSDCENSDDQCLHPVGCCVKWLNEEVVA